MAGVGLPWSNGQTEGQVNKLKLLKRQMFGRAGIDLLRRASCWRVEDPPSGPLSSHAARGSVDAQG